MLSWIQIRGLIAFAAVVAAIAWAWDYSENRESAPEAILAVTTTTTTTTSTVPLSTTTSPEQARQAMCEQARSFVAEAALIPDSFGPGTLAELALDFYAGLRQVVSSAIDAELVSVIAHYQDFINTGEPYDYTLSRVILEGDKEQYEQLVTRPFPGLDVVRAHIAEQCSLETPDQYRISASAFKSLEDRLLDRR